MLLFLKERTQRKESQRKCPWSSTSEALLSTQATLLNGKPRQTSNRMFRYRLGSKPPDCALRQHQPQTVKAEGHGSEKETAAGKKRIREKRKRRKKWTNQIARKWGKEGAGEASFVKLL